VPRALATIAWLAGTCVSLPAFAADGPTGLWLTEDGRGVVSVETCGDALCGRIAGMRHNRNADGTVPVDWQGRPKCGETIFSDMRQTEPGLWRGHITNPDDGKVWSAQIRMDDQGRLLLRGYVLLPALGQTQTWPRYNGSRPAQDCAIP
jgi:uncharacterized protein (DUF2147 family)